MNSDDRVKIGDFGLANIAANISQMSQPNSGAAENAVELPNKDLTKGCGTPLYMAPEQKIGIFISVTITVLF